MPNSPVAAPRNEESAERLARPLIQLAKANGISTSYIDQLGAYVEIRDEVLVSVLRALGVDASTDEAVTKSYEATVRKTQTTLVPSTIVKFLGTPTAIPIRPAGRNVTLRLLLEDGTAYAGNLAMCLLAENDGTLRLNLPDDIPSGYHTLRINAGDAYGEATLICAPASIPVPKAVADRQRWGWMAQMYSVRSSESWGVGDYGDLRHLLKDAAEKTHADFMLINPIHACAPIPPLEPSPYLPESRRFLNVTYITPDPDPVDTPNEGGEDAQSVLTMYTFMDTVPDLVGTAWSFIGGCVNGVVMTEDQVNQVLSQMDDYYQFYFNDETTVTLYQGNDTAPEGTYSAVNDTTVKIEVEGVTYAAVFAEGEYGPLLVAMLDSTGTNALVFEMVVEG